MAIHVEGERKDQPFGVKDNIWTFGNIFTYKYIVSSRGDVQLGGPALVCTLGGPTKAKARKSILFTEGSPV